MQKHNFSAGPAILPDYTLRNCSDAVEELDSLNLSLLEISHRSEWFVEIMEKARGLVRELLGVPEGYSVLFLQGGARQHFAQIPMNLIDDDKTAAYINTGSWSMKAINEAQIYGNVKVIASSEHKDYTYIPKKFDVPASATYVHITTNNTIYGTQWKDIPDTGNIPIVADMSSDIFSYPVDVSKFGVIYAGAQKNLGPAGATLVIVRDDLLGNVNRELPQIFDYRSHIKKDSAFNTPPVFSIYGCLQTLIWIKEEGGIKAMQKRNEQKAEKLYQAIDKSPLFKGTVEPEDRSVMNATFVVDDPELEKKFLQVAEDSNIVGIKGHRSVGGFRASMYNALPQESVDALIELMEKFAQKHA